MDNLTQLTLAIRNTIVCKDILLRRLCQMGKDIQANALWSKIELLNEGTVYLFTK